MNNRGEIAGIGYDANGEASLAMLYRPDSGVITLPRPPGASWYEAYAINEAGHVAGGYSASGDAGTSIFPGFVYRSDGDPLELLGEFVGPGWVLPETGAPYKIVGPEPDWATWLPGGTLAAAGGYSAGFSYSGIGTDSALAWRRNPDGSFTDVGDQPGFDESLAWGVDSFGVTVGRYRLEGATGGGSAFAYVDGVGAIDLFEATDPLTRGGWIGFFDATDVLDDGRIMGIGSFSRAYPNTPAPFPPGPLLTTYATFVLTPIAKVPEPGTLALLSLGLLGLGVMRRRTN